MNGSSKYILWCGLLLKSQYLILLFLLNSQDGVGHRMTVICKVVCFKKQTQFFEVQDCFWFPKASVTKYHRMGVLKQQKFIVSQLWSLGKRKV